MYQYAIVIDGVILMNAIKSIYMVFGNLCISSFWIAFVSAFGPVMLCKIAKLPLSPVASLIVFLVTFGVYAFDKVSGSKEDLQNNPRRANLAKYPIKQLAALSYGAAILIVAITDIWKLPCVLIVGLAGLLYTVKIWGVRPKDVLGIKNLLVASSTAICYAGLVSHKLWLYELTFLLIFIDTTIFDLRDMIGDRAAGVRTLPVVLGRAPTMLILAAVDLLIYVLSPIVSIIGAFLLLYFRKERDILCYDFLVDAWMMWVVLALWLFQWPYTNFF
jgi:4-hydroxybenzoate polyprenyltransferase